MLPAGDHSYLEGRGAPYSVSSEANMTCVVIQGFPLPCGYDRSSSDLLLRLAPGYPDVPPDMWWFDPPVRLNDGRSAPSADLMEHYLGRTWQRWSRHLPPGQWMSGIDSLESFLALIRKELERCSEATAR